MFFLRGKEGSARLGRFSFPARICGRADSKRCVENVKDINREDRSKARMRMPTKRIASITTKVIIIVIKSRKVVRYPSVKRMREMIGKIHKGIRNLQRRDGYFCANMILFLSFGYQRNFFIIKITKSADF